MSETAPRAHADEVLIDAASAGRGPRWRELWRYRELLLVFVQRDVAVRYQDTALGVLWAVLQPLGFIAVFTFAFGRVAREATGDVPYPLYVLAGLLPWLLFANSFTSAGQSILAARNLITKIYFPRLILPLAAIGPPVIDFAVTAVLLIVALIAFDRELTAGLLLLPLLALHAVAVAAGAGCLAAALAARYRDVRYALTFIVSAWMFLTPVFYAPSFLPEGWRWLLHFNPMAGVVEGFRFACLGISPDPTLIWASCVTTLLLLSLGLWYFRAVERTFDDVL